MTEITQADRDAAERLIETVSMTRNSLAEAFARHRMEERAAIVAWLRRHKAGIAPIRIVETSTISKTQSLLIDAIEAGRHLK